MAYSKMLWATSTPPTPTIPSSWDYWTTIYNKRMMNFGSDYYIQKSFYRTNGIIYYGFFWNGYNGNVYFPPGYYAIGVCPTNIYRTSIVCMSTQTGDTVNMYGSTTNSIIGADGLQWYQSSKTTKPTPFNYKPTEDYLYLGEFSAQTAFIDAETALINKIYAVPFHENYTLDETYNIGFTDTRKTIRKAISTMLHKNLSLYDTDAGYIKISDEAENIVNWFVQCLADKNLTNSIIYVYASRDIIQVGYGTTCHGYAPSVSRIPSATVTYKNTADGYTICEFDSPYMENPYYGRYSDCMDLDWVADVEYDYENNILNYTVWDSYDSQFMVGQVPFRAGIRTYSIGGSISVELTNLGIDL